MILRKWTGIWPERMNACIRLAKLRVESGRLDEPAAFDVERDVIKSIAGGEGCGAVFEEGEADEVVTGDRETGFAAGSDADDASAAFERWK